MERDTKLEIVQVYKADVIKNDIPQIPNRKVTIYWDMDGNEIGKNDIALKFKDILGL